MKSWEFGASTFSKIKREVKYEKEIGVHTTGTRKLEQERKSYFSYQPTSYEALNRVFEKYPFNDADQFIDFGCGLGRVLFCAEKYGCKDVIGVEVNEEIYSELLDNIEKYGGKNKIRVYSEAAEKFHIESKANKFFFFNPFYKRHLITVMNNIRKSLIVCPRRVYLFFYAPSESYIQYLASVEGVKLLEIIQPTDENVGVVYVYMVDGEE